MDNIFNYNELDKILKIKRNLKLLNKICVGRDLFRYNILYNKNNTLIIQTPYIYLPFKPMNNSINIPFYNNDSNSNNLEQMINSINKFLLNKIKKIENVKYIFHQNIQETISIYDKKMRVPFCDNILLFDNNSNKISRTEITSKITCKLLITPSYIWLSDNKIGVYWKIIQLKLLKPLVPKVESFINNIKIKDHSILEKYLKMKKCGVPLPAIINKINLDGCDELLTKLIEQDPETICNGCKYCNNTITNTNINTNNDNFSKIKEENNTITIDTNIKPKIEIKTNMSFLLKDIKKGIKLKNPKERKINLIKKEINDNYKPPSLDSILNKLKTLKKTGIILKTTEV